MATTEQGIIAERKRLATAIAAEKNENRKFKLLEEDQSLRDQLASLYAQNSPQAVADRAKARQQQALWNRFGTTDPEKAKAMAMGLLTSVPQRMPGM